MGEAVAGLAAPGAGRGLLREPRLRRAREEGRRPRRPARAGGLPGLGEVVDPGQAATLSRPASALVARNHRIGRRGSSPFARAAIISRTLAPEDATMPAHEWA